MAITRLGSTDRFVEIVNGTGSAGNLAAESGWQAGDLDLIAVSWYDNGSATLSTPSGYTRAGGTDYTLVDGSTKATLFYKVLDGTEGASSIQFSANAYANAVRLTLRGASALEIVAGSFDPGTAANGTTVTSPDIAGSAGQMLLCPMYIGDPATFSTPADMTAGPWNSSASTDSLRWFYQALAADAGAKSSTLSVTRNNRGFALLAQETGPAVEQQPPLTTGDTASDQGIGGDYTIGGTAEPASGSAVGADLDARWDVLAAAGASLDAQWGTLTTAGASLDARWALVTAAGAEIDARWATLAAIGASLDAQWDMSGTVGASLDAQWATLAATGASLDARWSLASAVGTNLDAQWSLVTAAGAEIDARWAALAAIGASLDAQWSMAGTAGNALDAQWAVVTAVGAEIDARWAMLASAASDLDARWDAVTAIGASFDAQWDMSGTVGASLDLQWAALAAVGNDIDAQWGLLTAAAADLDARWDVLTPAGTELDLQWAALSAVGADLDARWGLGDPLSAVGADLDLRYDLIATTGAALDLRWRNGDGIEQPGGGGRWLRDELARRAARRTTPVGATLDLRWQIAEPAAAPVGADLDLRWQIAEPRVPQAEPADDAAELARHAILKAQADAERAARDHAEHLDILAADDADFFELLELR